MNKWRRQHKQRQRRLLTRLRAFKAFMRGVVGAREAAAGLAHVQMLQSTPAGYFEGGQPGKVAAIAKAVLTTYDAIKKSVESIR